MSFTDWPGAGPVPEPEPEGFRDEQVAAERERLIQEEKDRLEASKALKDELSGKPEAPPPPEGGATKSKSTSHKSDKAGWATSATITRPHAAGPHAHLMANPLPKPDARKQRHAVAQHNATRLPVTGRVGRPPKCPVDLDVAGQRWWRWAWSTPQATQWHKGFMEPLALRASLEDDFAKLTEPADRARLLGHMNRLDESFALTPKAAIAMHLTFVDEPVAPKAVDVEQAEAKVTPIRGRLKGMRDE